MRISDWSSDACSSDQRVDVALQIGEAGRIDRVINQFREQVPLIDCGLDELLALGERAGRGRRSGRGCSATSGGRSEEHTSELQSLMRISYAVFCLKKKT